MHHASRSQEEGSNKEMRECPDVPRHVPCCPDLSRRMVFVPSVLSNMSVHNCPSVHLKMLATNANVASIMFSINCAAFVTLWIMLLWTLMSPIAQIRVLRTSYQPKVVEVAPTMTHPLRVPPTSRTPSYHAGGDLQKRNARSPTQEFMTNGRRQG